jgi:hypothetical protein
MTGDDELIELRLKMLEFSKGNYTDFFISVIDEKTV